MPRGLVWIRDLLGVVSMPAGAAIRTSQYRIRASHTVRTRHIILQTPQVGCSWPSHSNRIMNHTIDNKTALSRTEWEFVTPHRSLARSPSDCRRVTPAGRLRTSPVCRVASARLPRRSPAAVSCARVSPPRPPPPPPPSARLARPARPGWTVRRQLGRSPTSVRRSPEYQLSPYDNYPLEPPGPRGGGGGYDAGVT